jgi:integrase/recombinase XerC
VEAFVWDPSVAAGTRAGRDRTLRTFFRWAVENNLLAESPLEDLLRPQKPERLPRNVTLEELGRIIIALRTDYREKRARNACQSGELIWMEQAFRFAFLTGLRLMEIARLRWRDIDLSRRRLYLFRQKGGREEALPLGRKATSLLTAMGEGPPESYVFAGPRGPHSARNEQSFATRLSKVFTRYRRAAGIERKVTFHGLRHGFCTTLAEAGASGPVIQAAARHRDLSTSMRYVHLTGNFLRQRIDDAFGT